jgi:hypothetical protein
LEFAHFFAITTISSAKIYVALISRKVSSPIISHGKVYSQTMVSFHDLYSLSASSLSFPIILFPIVSFQIASLLSSANVIIILLSEQLLSLAMTLYHSVGFKLLSLAAWDHNHLFSPWAFCLSSFSLLFQVIISQLVAHSKIWRFRTSRLLQHLR